jgi:tRNA threonylcarbamoyladenosine biosynthesis protein TsaB
MKILGLDTAHGFCSVALTEKNQLVAQKIDRESSKQAERLFSIIDDLLKENNYSYQNINAIAVNIGPGSFTGVRIGMAAAYGIAIAAQIPIVGVDGFTALASHIKAKNILVALDAKRGQIFAKFFNNNSFTEELLIYYNEITDFVGGDTNFNIIGDGADLIAPFLREKSINFSITPEPKLPDASMIARVAYQKIIDDNFVKQPIPLYIRTPDAKLPKN